MSAMMEAIEPRLLLAVIGGTTQQFPLAPAINNAGDGSGNKFSLRIPAVLSFSTATFGRLDTTYDVVDFSATDGGPDGTFQMTFALWKNNDAGDTLTAADTKITNLGPSTSTELDAGRYLYVITPTTGDDATVANVNITLKNTSVAGAKILVTGNSQTLADGDTTPSLDDFTNFGSVPVGVINVDRSFTVKNTGGSALSLGAISVPAGFVVKAGLPGTLASGASANFTLTLGTAGAGIKSGTVSFGTSDASVGTFSFNITGNVNAAALPAKSGLQRLRINGTSGNDTIALTQNATRIIFNVNGNLYSVRKNKITKGISVDAFHGNDAVTVDAGITLPVLVVGNVGNDTLIGGAGKDTLLGLAGDDVLRGGGDADSLDGGNGGDTADYTDKTLAVRADLEGDADDGTTGELDQITTSTENILGGGANDTLTGSNGTNFLNGGVGNDFLLGLGGADLMRGGKGNDTMRPGTGVDTLIGEAGSDMADYSERAISVSLSNDDVANDGVASENDNISSDIERVAGGSAGDFIDLFADGSIAFGFGGGDTIRGTDGNDALFGGDGNDNINGFGGNDYIEGNAGNDDCHGLRGNDTVLGGDGNDFIGGESDNDSVNGEGGNDTAGGDRGIDIVHGGPGDDHVNTFFQNAGGGTEGTDSLFGDEGNDTLASDDNFGNPGVGDILDGGDGSDTATDVNVLDTLINFP